MNCIIAVMTDSFTRATLARDTWWRLVITALNVMTLTCVLLAIKETNIVIRWTNLDSVILLVELQAKMVQSEVRVSNLLFV